jgi:hypothetical protein
MYFTFASTFAFGILLRSRLKAMLSQTRRGG